MKQIRRTKEENRNICKKIKDYREIYKMTFTQVASQFEEHWHDWSMEGELLRESSLRKLYKRYKAGDFDDDEESKKALFEAISEEFVEKTETHTCYISSWDDEGKWMPSVKIEVEIPANLKQEHKELVRDYELAMKLKREWI